MAGLDRCGGRRSGELVAIIATLARMGLPHFPAAGRTRPPANRPISRLGARSPAGPLHRAIYLPPNHDGSARSLIVRKPGGAAMILGMELTVIEAVATSPWTPPLIFCSMRGRPSIVTAS